MTKADKILIAIRATLMLSILLLFCQCSILKKKVTVPFINIPSVYFSCMDSDTTFKFKEMIKDKYGYNNYVSVVSSNYDKLNNIKGGARFYVLIDKNSRIIGIQPIEVILRKKKSYLSLENNVQPKDDTKWNALKDFIQSNCSKLDIIKTKVPTDTLHPTYCVFMFI